MADQHPDLGNLTAKEWEESLKLDVERQPGVTDDEQDLDLLVTLRIPSFNKFSRVGTDMLALCKELFYAGYGPTEAVVMVVVPAEPEVQQKVSRKRAKASKPKGGTCS